MKRRSRFRYDSENVRYCDTDAAYMLNCWSPRTSLKVTADPPNRSPPLVTPTLTGGRRPRTSSRTALSLILSAIACVPAGLESMMPPGEPNFRRGRGDDRVALLERVELVVALVVPMKALRAKRSRGQHHGEVLPPIVSVYLAQSRRSSGSASRCCSVAVARDVGVDRWLDWWPWTERRACRRRGTARRVVVRPKVSCVFLSESTSSRKSFSCRDARM